MLRFVRLAFSLSLRRRACGSSPAPPTRLRLLLASSGSPSSWLLVLLPAPVPSLPAHRPADRVEQAGRHSLACLPLSCGEVLLRVASLPLSHKGRLCFLGVVPFLSKDFPRQSFKTFLGNVLKTFPDNLLEMAKHVPLPICPAPPSCDLRRSALSPIVSLFSLSRLCFELIKTAHSFAIASRSAPRPVVPSFLSSARAIIKLCFPLIAICFGSPTLLAHRAASPDAPPNRHARRGEERGEAVAWRFY